MRRPALLCLLLSFGACHKEEPAPVPPPAAKVAPQTEAAAKGVGPGGGIIVELQAEAANRPKGTPTVEQVIAAIEAAGMKMSQHSQVLGTPIKAHYCQSAATMAGLGMSICEYDDAEQAKAGRERSLVVFKGFPNRTLVVNASTLLTVTQTTDAPEIVAEKTKVLDLFAKLSAR